MRRGTIAYAQNNVPVECVSERDFLFPDADEKYVPEVLAYIQSYDFQMFNALLGMLTPEAVVATFPYLSDRERGFCLRALFERWSQLLADGWQGEPLPPHLMQWIARKRLHLRQGFGGQVNGYAGDDHA
ncbi:MAG: hypothetical protein ACREDM_00110 [Methylocella sp.]